MALSLTTAIKNQAAMRIYSGRTYAALGAGYEQDLIDTEGAAALIELENYANWFVLAAGTGAAPDAWAPWFADRIVARIETNAHPERVEAANRTEARSKADALATYARLSPAYDPASTTEAFVYQMVNVRKFVIAHCARMRPALFPDPMTIDAAWEEVYKTIWNKGNWNMARRTVTFTVTPTAITAGTWSSGAKTITVSPAAFTATSNPGSYVVITGGTNAVQKEYPVTSASSTVLTLPDDIGATNGSADITGYYVTVSFTGLEAGESFDSTATVNWYYNDNEALGWALTWMSADAFAVRRGVDANFLDRPRFFRIFNIGGNTAWRFTPQPDQAYTCRGEVFTFQPAAPASGTATTLFDKFAPQFLPIMRRFTLAKVLTNYDRHNAALSREVDDDITELFPTLQDVGEADDRQGITDVYHDASNFLGNGVPGLGRGPILGGPL